MVNLLFSSQGRINRGRFWFGVLLQLGGMAIVAMLTVILWQLIPGTVDDQGGFQVNGVTAIPYLALIFGSIVAVIWSGICLNVKRYHDRGKSGLWMLVVLIPFVGGLWNLIETGFLSGATGPNKFGPDASQNNSAYAVTA